MKISLTSERSIPILTVSDGISSHETQILRAGLTKILKTGKNKIILELPQIDSLPSEVIREVATFDVMARELSGRVVLANVSPRLKTKIEIFAKPPVVMTFENRSLALEFLIAPPKAPAQALSPEVSFGSVLPGGVENTGHVTSMPHPTSEPVAGDFAHLKLRIQELEAENQRLKEQVVVTTIARRPPQDERVYLETIQRLEAKIQKMMTDAAS